MFSGRSPRRLAVELTAVLLVVAAVIAGVALRTRQTHPPAKNDRPLGGPQLNLSHSDRAQNEVAAVADPRDPKILLAGSTDRFAGTRIYASRDGGRSWTTAAGPPLLRAPCGGDDPTVAIDGGGRQYYGFLATQDCRPPTPKLVVATRASATGRWQATRVFPERSRYIDQAPWLAAGAGGHAYVVWIRLYETFTKNAIVTRPVVYLSRSDDGGRTWSSGEALRGYTAAWVARVAVAPNGDVVVAVADAKRAELAVLRSRDGGRHFGAETQASALREPPTLACGRGSVFIPAQPQRCVGTDPTIVFAKSGDTIVVYGEPEADGTQAVWSVAIGPEGDVGLPRRVAPPDTTKADQFWPTAAIDRSDGLLWACYYDTAGDKFRRKAWFTCTASKDGGEAWAQPLRAADVPSDETEIAGDRRGYGDYQALVAADGVAHPLWTDTRNLVETNEEIFGSSIPEGRLSWQQP